MSLTLPKSLVCDMYADKNGIIFCLKTAKFSATSPFFASRLIICISSCNCPAGVFIILSDILFKFAMIFVKLCLFDVIASYFFKNSSTICFESGNVLPSLTISLSISKKSPLNFTDESESPFSISKSSVSLICIIERNSCISAAIPSFNPEFTILP